MIYIDIEFSQNPHLSGQTIFEGMRLPNFIVYELKFYESLLVWSNFHKLKLPKVYLFVWNYQEFWTNFKIIIKKPFLAYPPPRNYTKYCHLFTNYSGVGLTKNVNLVT